MAAIELNENNLPRLAPRAVDCHKGQLGHAVILAGAPGMGGAGLLAAQACLRLGAGLVSLLTSPEQVSASLARQPEVMVHGVTEMEQLQPVLQQATTLLLGPGIGQTTTAIKMLQQAAALPVAQIWDADSLNLLARHSADFTAEGVRILTPHPGEAARLLDCSVASVQADREQAALQLARRYNSLVLLKGFGSLIADPGGQLLICRHGHPVMAGPGFGDVLGGVIAALLAQGMAPLDATCLAVWLHARAGEELAGEGRGVVASDLLSPMRRLLQDWSPVTQPGQV